MYIRLYRSTLKYLKYNVTCCVVARKIMQIKVLYVGIPFDIVLGSKTSFGVVCSCLYFYLVQRITDQRRCAWY
jgi:flagellar biosynthesis protein FliR